MKNAALPLNDKERIKALKAYGITNTKPERDYDEIAKLAKVICNTQVCLITFIDQDTQWFKAHQGTDINRNSRDLALCSHSLNNPNEITYAPDTLKDDRFNKNPMVTGPTEIRFYAGAPLVNNEGYVLGTICVMDQSPHALNDKQMLALELLARQVMNLLELRRNNFILQQREKELEEKNKELGNFAAAVSHDIKGPLNNIYAITELLQTENSQELNDTGKEYINYLSKSSSKLNSIVEGILTYYKNTHIQRKKTEVDLDQSINDILSIIDDKNEVKLIKATDLPTIEINKAALELIFSNLITNALKYNDKPSPEITIYFEESQNEYQFKVSDNGPGIAQKDLKRIFKHYTNLGREDRNKKLGTGLGLALVKKITNDLGGSIQVESTLGEGTTFTFTLPK
ncbi:MAG: GAF domain-containing sensor histidine kinase [Fulvivirga sp.]